MALEFRFLFVFKTVVLLFYTKSKWPADRIQFDEHVKMNYILTIGISFINMKMD